MYKIVEKEDHLEIEGLDHFDPKHIFECGQAFRWEKTGSGSYIAVAYERVAEFNKVDDKLYVYNSTKEDFENIWHNYFNLDVDYGKLREEIRETKAYKLNDSLKEALEFGDGLRILNQDRFEMIISFIISANNQIPRIKNSVELLSKTYGQVIGNYKGKTYFAFPEPEDLAFQDPLEVKEITRVGFRNERIVEAAKRFMNNPKDFDDLDLENLKSKLIDLPGVGPKVMDCILLFGYGVEETFPIDVWVQRLMETLYLDKPIPKTQILANAKDLFGDYLGHAQQYLFYYARENNIGK